MLAVRPERIVVYSAHDKPKELKLAQGQKRYHKAAETISKIEGWRFVELWDDEGLIEAVSFQETVENGDELELGQRDAQLLNLLIKHDDVISARYENMAANVMDTLVRITESSVTREIETQNAYWKLFHDYMQAKQDASTNGESMPDKVIGDFMGMLKAKAMAGDDMTDVMKKFDQMREWQKQAEAAQKAAEKAAKKPTG